VKRQLESGRQTIEVKLPALLTVELDLTTPRYATLPEFVRALKQDIRVWGASQIEAPAERLGLKGSPTWVKEIFVPKPQRGGIIFDGTGSSEQVVDNFLAAFLGKEAGLLGELFDEGKG